MPIDRTPTMPAAGTGGAAFDAAWSAFWDAAPLLPREDRYRNAMRVALAAYDRARDPTPDAVPHPDAVPDLPAGGAGLPTVEILALRVRNAVEGECGGFAVGYKESLEIAAYALTGLPPGPDRGAALARLAERRPAAGVEPAPGRVDAWAVRADRWERALCESDGFDPDDHSTRRDNPNQKAYRAIAREGMRLADEERSALDAALDRAGDGPASGPSEEDLSIIARSIGRTVRERNHLVRAQDVFRSLRERDLSTPPSPSAATPPSTSTGAEP